jgi:hypothetical protein
MWRVVLLSVTVLALAGTTLAETYVVNPDGTGDFPTIQAAVDAAQDGDIVELTDGMFSGPGNCNVMISRKHVSVRSQGGDPRDCIIDCAGSEDGIMFDHLLETDAVISGITIRSSSFSGYGVYCYHSSPLVERCIFDDLGVGLDLHGSSPDSVVTSDVRECIFRDCRRYGVICAQSAYPEITNCTIYGCTETGFKSRSGSLPRITNSMIVFTTDGPAIVCQYGGAVTLECCDVYGNAGGDWIGCIEEQYGINGNICEDPLFCDPENGDFHLDCSSPCAPFSPPNEECDLIGAWPVGCGGTPTTRSTWGGVKALFRD